MFHIFANNEYKGVLLSPFLIDVIVLSYTSYKLVSFHAKYRLYMPNTTTNTRVSCFHRTGYSRNKYNGIPFRSAIIHINLNINHGSGLYIINNNNVLIINSENNNFYCNKNYMIISIKKLISGGSAKNRPFKKIDRFVSNSHVDFLKAHIKIS